MKLPDNAVIAREKLTHYLLVHLPKNDKSAWLARAGYNMDNIEILLADLRAQILANPSEHVRAVPHGDYFKIDGPLQGPNGHILHIRSIWMKERLSGITKFITLYPVKGKSRHEI